MLLDRFDRWIHWFDYPNNVQLESPVTLTPLEETIEPMLWDDNTPK